MPSRVKVEIDPDAFFVMDSLNGNDFVARQSWLHGYLGFEKPLPAIYTELVRDAELVIGVGSNSGFYELAAAALNDHARIIAFEPYPPAIRALKNNLALNKFDHRIEVIDKAISSLSGNRDFFIPKVKFGDTLETSASLASDFRDRHSAVISVETITLDQFIVDCKIESLQLIRADVEGSEDEVVQGATRTISLFRPIVILEVITGNSISGIHEAFSSQDYVYAFFDASGRLNFSGRLEIRAGSPNQIVCPNEKIPYLESAAASAKLEVSRSINPDEKQS